MYPYRTSPTARGDDVQTAERPMPPESNEPAVPTTGVVFGQQVHVAAVGDVRKERIEGGFLRLERAVGIPRAVVNRLGLDVGDQWTAVITQRQGQAVFQWLQAKAGEVPPILRTSCFAIAAPIPRREKE